MKIDRLKFKSVFPNCITEIYEFKENEIKIEVIRYEAETTTPIVYSTIIYKEDLSALIKVPYDILDIETIKENIDIIEQNYWKYLEEELVEHPEGKLKSMIESLEKHMDIADTFRKSTLVVSWNQVLKVFELNGYKHIKK